MAQPGTTKLNVEVEVTNVCNPLIGKTFRGWTVVGVETDLELGELRVEVDQPGFARRYVGAWTFEALNNESLRRRRTRYSFLLDEPEPAAAQALCFAVALATRHREEDVLLQYADSPQIAALAQAWNDPNVVWSRFSAGGRGGGKTQARDAELAEVQRQNAAIQKVCDAHVMAELGEAAAKHQEELAARMFFDASVVTYPCAPDAVFNRGDAVFVGPSGLLRHLMTDDTETRDDVFMFDPARMRAEPVPPVLDQWLEATNARAAEIIAEREAKRERRCGPLPQMLFARVPLSAVPRRERTPFARMEIDALPQRDAALAALLDQAECVELARWKRTHRAWPLCRLGGTISVVWVVRDEERIEARGVWRCSKCDNQGGAV